MQACQGSPRCHIELTLKYLLWWACASPLQTNGQGWHVNCLPQIDCPCPPPLALQYMPQHIQTMMRGNASRYWLNMAKPTFKNIYWDLPSNTSQTHYGTPSNIPPALSMEAEAPQKLGQSHWCVPFTATFSKRRKIGAFWSERCDGCEYKYCISVLS